MGKKGQRRPPPQNPHYASEVHPSAPPPYTQSYAPPPQQNYQPQHASRGGGGGQRQGRPPPRRNVPSEVSDCVKYSLFLYNFIFWVVGALFIAAGIWAFHDRGVFNELKELGTSNISFLTDPVIWLFFLGSVVFILGTMGCLGALRENICMLKTFTVMMGIILLLEIGGGIAVYFYRAEIEGEITNFVSDVTIKEYRDNPDFQDLIDAVQTSLSCCGVVSYNDWDMNIYFNCSGPPRNPEACGVPFSCCVPEGDSEVVNTQCGYGVRKMSDSIASKIYTSGCIDEFRAWINTYLYYLAGVAGLIILVELFGFCFAQSLINDVKRQRSRWVQHR
ncbi:Tetraspanin-17 [Holothuria leucospilota]|uniref:Tetraspanin-33 n=1 Tax=Holothuria leucospilota TaxID=206669 RepID=A0A9Q1BER8_HOLLE|nr:Tetraspanin-17 [Holothuria leucospilota]